MIKVNKAKNKIISKTNSKKNTKIKNSNYENINFKNGIFLYLKGFLMGTCDIIPGISGGTIAFITGIYMRLITAIKGLTPKSLFELGKTLITFNLKKINNEFKKLDLYFLLVLFFGMFSAILTVSYLVKYLLETHYVYTLTFFVGLILASSKIIFNEISSHKIKDILFGIFGFALGFSMVFLSEGAVSDPSLLFVFLGGFLAVSALFLPGISGSFILLVLGLYGFVLDALHDILNQYQYLIAFGLGAILGAFFISRLITHLYTINKPRTLYVLLGLVLGSLFVPIKEILNSINQGGAISFGFMFALFNLGIILVVLVNKYSKEEN